MREPPLPRAPGWHRGGRTATTTTIPRSLVFVPAMLALVVLLFVTPVSATGFRGRGTELNAQRRQQSHQYNGVDPESVQKLQRCEPEHQEVCGNGQGFLICEYNADRDWFASRCVRQAKITAHLQLHAYNYCGACQRCFEDTEELHQAIGKFMENQTQHTDVAHSYGWPIGTWCVSKLTDFTGVFSNYRKFNLDISKWDVSRATSFNSMFHGAFAFNQDISGWNTTLVRDMGRMFDCAYGFNAPIGTWDVHRVTSMAGMFRVAKAFDQDINAWQVNKVQDMSHMFYRAHSFNGPIDLWDTEEVVDMSYMFSFTRKFNATISHWDLHHVETMRAMFQNALVFQQDISGWDVSRVTDMGFLFQHAPAMEADVEKQRAILQEWDLTQVQDQTEMFSFATAFNATSVMSEAIVHPSYQTHSGRTPIQTESSIPHSPSSATTNAARAASTSVMGESVSR